MDISKKESYKTVSGDGEAVYTDKKSKFIAHAIHAESEQEALDFLQRMRAEYSDATHNVYAYVIDENNIFRYSDDGEPGGTAGMPVLDVMRKDGIVDAAVVVTRYFGGTLLGTGGLVHAYSTAARMGVCDAGVVTRVLCRSVVVETDYTMVGKIQHLTASEGYILENTDFSERVKFSLCLKKEQVDKFISSVTELTCGRAVIKNTGEKYIDLKEG